MTMNIRRRDGSNAERASGRRVGSGRRRTVDVDENHNYHPVAFRVSDALYRKLRLAVALSGSPTQQGFIIEALEPAIRQGLGGKRLLSIGSCHTSAPLFHFFYSVNKITK